MKRDTEFGGDEFTDLDQDFFRRGEEIAHTPPPVPDAFDDLNDLEYEPRPVICLRQVRARLARLASAVPRPAQLSARGRRAAYVAAGLLALSSLALAVPNEDRPLTASASRTTAISLPRVLGELPRAVLTDATVVHAERADVKVAQVERESSSQRAPSRETEPAPSRETEPAPPPAANPAASAEVEVQADEAPRTTRKPSRTASRISKRTSRRGKAHYDRGLQAWKRRDLAAARNAFAAAARAGHAPGYRALGVLYRKQGKKEQAIRAFRTYLRVAPKSSDADKVRRSLARLDQT